MKPRLSVNLAVLVVLIVTARTDTVFAKTKSSPTQPTATTTTNEADQTLAALKSGNQRFVSGKARTDGQTQADIHRLATGQSPKAIVLSCSDSRVPPELVFDQKLGEVFTVRSAGESLSGPAIGSIEFAIAKLGSKLIVVMGHTSCGAIKAAVETPDGTSAGSENLDQLVSDIKPRIAAASKSGGHSSELTEESWANAKGVAQDLVARSKIISSAVQTGKIKIVVGLYHLDDGTVTFAQ